MDEKLDKWEKSDHTKSIMRDMPENEEDILRFLDSAVLEDQPTEVLVQLAQKLKDRRAKIYHEGGP